MCGILFGRRLDGLPIAKSLSKRYQQQSQRGKQGFGYIAIKNDKVETIMRAKHEGDILEALRKETSSAILFHHRLPTSTPNTLDTTHPIAVINKLLKKNYYVIHNGIINNADDLCTEHTELGFLYTTAIETKTIVQSRTEYTESSTFKFNDSEALAIDLALTLEGKQTAMKAQGTISFIVIQTDKKDRVEKILYGHNYGNPLVRESNLGTDKKGMFFLKSLGKGADVPTHELHSYDWKTGQIETKMFQVGKATAYTNPIGFRNDAYDYQDVEYDMFGRQTFKPKGLPSPYNFKQGNQGKLDWDDDRNSEPRNSRDQAEYEALQEQSLRAVQTRLDELVEERLNLTAEIDFAEQYIEDAGRGLTHDERDFYQECIDQNITRLELVDDEIKKIEDMYEIESEIYD